MPGLTQGDMGTVHRGGWDFGQVAEGITNDYLFDGPLEADDMFTATLTWFRNRATVGTSSYQDVKF